MSYASESSGKSMQRLCSSAVRSAGCCPPQIVSTIAGARNARYAG